MSSLRARPSPRWVPTSMHLRAPAGTPMANVFVSLMQAIGHDEMRAFGDSTGEFALRFPRGPATADGDIGV